MSIYSPEKMPRQGEINAWALTFITFGGVFFLSLRESIPSWVWFLSGMFAFSAASISLGNWIDRQTTIEIGNEAVRFENGLRKVRLEWQEVYSVKVTPARWGRSVQVSGKDGFFSFATLGVMTFRNEVKSRTGFEKGDEILDSILREAKLDKYEKMNRTTVYTR